MGTARRYEASLDQLQAAASPIEAGESLDPELAAALNQAKALGGLRPKAFVNGNGRSFIAKLSSRSDQRPVTNLEAVAMDLAGRAGINVARCELALNRTLFDEDEVVDDAVVQSAILIALAVK